ncbi:GntR family transcriptional regulator [Phytohabitans sp. ZYX-F-186]|uniref:GntR family transcriptional regulator n=2 Tax=Phytohabitans TaxID=907364 RepID=A0A6F8YDL1_9ACTN|nr:MULTISPECIES: GntR family transcriptional regulator [Phytohabitans]MDQ7908884.1 GntR family transcriptional regulator [Phytohabitans sp. ZYX-F-186]BCB84224.1 GntR family transcriptional regulator [Phytohabitans suffuscus]
MRTPAEDDLVISNDLVAVLPPRGEPSRTEGELVYQRLRAAILLGRLRAGAVLVESELMERLGVGRTPLREAVRLLAHDGLVEVMPRRGTYVAGVEVENHGALVEARRGLEGVIAELAVKNATRAQCQAFDTFVGKAAEAEGGVETDLALDTEFHRRVLDMTANPYLAPFYWRLVGESMRMLNAAGATFEHIDGLLPTFERVADALGRRDVAVLRTVLVDHVASFEKRLLDAIRGWPSASRPL